MEVYLVGGAVRDKLMGLEVKDRDWVVVGAKPSDLLELGYAQVGKDFPVFLHPKTKEEYALARTEKKAGVGYKGFEFCVDAGISLEDDLLRRDLTINAIAEDKNGNIVDPFGGKEDIEHKVLRHVSEAFIEDPVRLLRLARFAARFADFTIHPDTQALIAEMVDSGEINNLVAERVWAEMVKGLQSSSSWVFFDVIKNCGAAKVLWPDFFRGGYADILKRLGAASAEVRFAAVAAECGKESILKFAARYKIPKDVLDLALVVSKHYKKCLELSAQPRCEEVLDILNSIDAWRRPGRIDSFFIAAFAQSAKDHSSMVELIKGAYLAADNVKASDVITDGISGKEIGIAINQKRSALIAAFLSKKA